MRRVIRLLALLLLAAMSIAISPAAVAEEHVFIQNYSELEEICEKTYTTKTKYYCRDEMVLEKDMTIPNNLHFQFVSLIIPEDVTLTVSEGAYVLVTALTVNGKLDNRGSISQEKWMKSSPYSILINIGENGHIINSGSLSVQDALPEGSVSGNGSHYKNRYYETFKDLTDAVSRAENDPETKFNLFIRSGKNIELIEDTVIPENLTVFLEGAEASVKETVKLTVLGGIFAYENASLVFRGDVINSGSIYLHGESCLTVYGHLINENWIDLGENSRIEVSGELQNNHQLYFMNESTAVINTGGLLSGSGMVHAEDGKPFPVMGESAPEFKRKGSGSDYVIQKTAEENMAGLKDVIQRATEAQTTDKSRYTIERDLVITEDLEIPKNLTIYIQNSRLTIETGCVLTVKGSLLLEDGKPAVLVSGEIANEGRVSLYDDAVMEIGGTVTNKAYLSAYDSSRIEVEGSLRNQSRGFLTLDNDSMLEIKAGGIYSGSGTVHIGDRKDFPVIGEGAPRFEENGNNHGNYVVNEEVHYKDPLSGATLTLPAGWDHLSGNSSESGSKAVFNLGSSVFPVQLLEYECADIWDTMNEEQRAKISRDQIKTLDIYRVGRDSIAKTFRIDSSEIKALTAGSHHYYVFPGDDSVGGEHSMAINALYTSQAAATLSNGYLYVFTLYKFMSNSGECREALKTILNDFDCPETSLMSGSSEFEPLFQQYKTPVIGATAILGLAISTALLCSSGKRKRMKEETEEFL